MLRDHSASVYHTTKGSLNTICPPSRSPYYGCSWPGDARNYCTISLLTSCLWKSRFIQPCVVAVWPSEIPLSWPAVCRSHCSSSLVLLPFAPPRSPLSWPAVCGSQCSSRLVLLSCAPPWSHPPGQLFAEVTVHGGIHDGVGSKRDEVEMSGHQVDVQQPSFMRHDPHWLH